MPNDFDTNAYQLGSMHPYVLYNNAGNEDLFVNDVVNETWVDRPPFDRVRKTIYGIEQDAKRAIASGVYEEIGDYAAGLQVTNYNQIFRYDGEFYIPLATTALPYTLTGDTGVDLPKFAPVGDRSLRQSLSLPGSNVAVAGAPAWQLALQSKGDDYTVIRESLQRIIAQVSAIGPQPVSLVTGDSLSIGGFGYPGGWPVDGGGYATANPFGLSSWAHMLRDTFFTSTTAFTPVESCDFTTNANTYFATSQFWNFALNQKVVFFNFANTTKSLKWHNTYSGAKAIVISYAPTSEAVLFEVDGTEYSNESPNGDYQSRGFMVVPCAGEYATITNVRLVTGGGAGGFWVYGLSEADRLPPLLTGKGGWTSAQILAEYETLVGQYTPDLAIYIIGANDLGLGVTVAQFKANVTSFVENVKADKANAHVLLISPPPSISYSRANAKSFIKALREVSDEYDCSVLDIYSKLENVDPSYYRFDNIHFNTQGDTLVFNILKIFVFPQLPSAQSKFTPVREAMLGVGGDFYKIDRPKPTFSCQLHMSATVELTYVGNQPAVEGLSATYAGAGVNSVVNVIPPVGYVVTSVEVVSLGLPTASRVYMHSLFADQVVALSAMSATANTDIIDSGLYCIVNYRKM